MRLKTAMMCSFSCNTTITHTTTATTAAVATITVMVIAAVHSFNFTVNGRDLSIYKNFQLYSA